MVHNSPLLLNLEGARSPDVEGQVDSQAASCMDVLHVQLAVLSLW